MSTLNKIKVGDTLYNLEDTEARTGLLNKIDKVEGKGLSTNDFTDEDKTKLDGLSNYDDTEIREELNDKANKNEIPSIDGLATEEYVNNIIANLPSGGGNGLNMPELIASGTMTEEARGITISLDNEGNSFELIATVLLISNGKRAETDTANATCSCTFRGNGKEASVGYATLEAATNKNKNITAVCNIMGIGYMIQGTGAAPSVGTPNMYGASNYCFPVTTVLFRHVSAVGKIGAGLTYELWGIRK